MKLKNVVLALGAFLAVVTASRAASAGYICGTTYRAASSTLGSEGYLYYTVYSGPDCTGDTLSINYLCSSGATSSVCASSSSYRYDRQSLIALYGSVINALTNNVYVSASTTSCLGGGSGCGAYFYVYSD
jgi:hypothetical protein